MLLLLLLLWLVLLLLLALVQVQLAVGAVCKRTAAWALDGASKLVRVGVVHLSVCFRESPAEWGVQESGVRDGAAQDINKRLPASAADTRAH
jgi:hypothetical protein